MLSTAVLLAASMVGQADGEATFNSWMDFSIGGAWTTTVDGVKSEMSYKRTLNGKLVQANLIDEGIHVTFIVGIDPVTKKCTWWGFDENGCVVKWVMSRISENVWMSEGKGMGPKGECALKEKLTRLDADTVKEEIEYFMINGKQQKAVTATWKRKR
jgi:hypothetical protein